MSIVQGLCQFGSSMYAAWKGKAGDDQLYYSALNGTTWTTPNTIPVFAGQSSPVATSSVGPSLALANGLLFAAWKSASDQTLWYASFDGQNWSGQTQIRTYSNSIISPANSNIGPSLLGQGENIIAAWANDDLSLSFAVLALGGWLAELGEWSVLPSITGAASSIGPSLAWQGSILYAAWMDPSGSLYYASIDLSNFLSQWSAPTQIVLPNTNPISTIGPSLAAHYSTLYAAWKGECNDQRLWYASFDPATSTWSDQTQIPGVASSIGPALASFGPTLTLYAMWKGEGSDERLWYASFDPSTSTWSGQQLGPGNTGQDNVPPPSAGLASSSNYIIGSANGAALQNPSVIITITEDVVIAPGVTNFGFQLNCYSTVNANVPDTAYVAWQQYLIVPQFNTSTNPQTVTCGYEGYLAVGPDTPFINAGALSLVPLTSTTTIPKNWTFTMALSSAPNDPNWNIIEADFTWADSTATPPVSNTVKCKVLALKTATGGPVTSANVAPICAFQLDIVGPSGGTSTAVFTSGAGTITYAAQNPLAAFPCVPPCAEVSSSTAEISNIYYTAVPAGANGTLVQNFGVNAQ